MGERGGWEGAKERYLSEGSDDHVFSVPAGPKAGEKRERGRGLMHRQGGSQSVSIDQQPDVYAEDPRVPKQKPAPADTHRITRGFFWRSFLFLINLLISTGGEKSQEAKYNC